MQERSTTKTYGSKFSKESNLWGIIKPHIQIFWGQLLDMWLHLADHIKFFRFHSNNFWFPNMYLCKKTLTLISVLCKKLEGRFMQEIFTNKDFGVARLFWGAKFVWDHHKSHTNLQKINFGYFTSFSMHSLGSASFLISLDFPLRRTFFLLRNRFLWVCLIVYETFGVSCNEITYFIGSQTLSLSISIIKKIY